MPSLVGSAASSSDTSSPCVSKVMPPTVRWLPPVPSNPLPTASTTCPASVRPKRESHAFGIGSSLVMVPVGSVVDEVGAVPRRVAQRERERFRVLVDAVLEDRDGHRPRCLAGGEGEGCRFVARNTL